MSWQRIETAPKDGSPLEGRFSDGRVRRITFQGEFGVEIHDDEVSGIFTPDTSIGGSIKTIFGADLVEWRPLRAPPERKG